MSTAELTRYTPDDLLEMPDGDRYELVDGQIVEKSMSTRSDWVAGEVFATLRDYAKQHGGWAFPETTYRCFDFDPNLIRKPDTSYIRAGQFEGDDLPVGHCRVVPDVAVEVVLPNDIYRSVEDKVDEYLRSGVKVVWVLNPENRSVRVFTESADKSVQYGANDELTAPDVLPGFRCKIAEFFGGASKPTNNA